MILGMEVAITVLALVLLVRGRSWDKKSTVGAHWRFRVLGGFLLTFWPFMFVFMVGLGFIWAMTHPHLTPDQLSQSLQGWVIGLEIGIILTYAIIAHFWHRAIVRRLEQEQADLPNTFVPADGP